ncbi:MAG: hypothetical protein WBG46_03970 [Nonlabens sp.]
MKNHIPKKWLYAITALWLVVLFAMSFVFDASQTAILITYVTGQGVVIAFWAPYWARKKPCESVK